MHRSGSDLRFSATEDGAPPFNLIAGSAWLWSREDMERSVDVLFIDEAGQLAGEDGILAPEQGLFLGETWRMRPEITRFTSELFYESKLESGPGLERRRITLADGSEPHGLVLELVEHEGNARESATEADLGLFRRLLGDGAAFTNWEGETRALGLSDLLVVAPYNAQVDRIRKALVAPGFHEPRVGTVDKFQGQEAGGDLPARVVVGPGCAAVMEFLYALDRLNVATSRARVLTVAVASPELLVAGCRLPQHMRLVNGVVRYGEMAGAGGTMTETR